jgi:hypothetical protein
MTEKEVQEKMGISYWHDNPPVAWMNKDFSDFGVGGDDDIPVFTFDTVVKLAERLNQLTNREEK